MPANKIVVLPNAVDIHRFQPNPNLRAETQTSLKLTTEPLLVFVGSFYQWHDIVTLLNALALVLKSNSQARLVLVGDGTEREKMMQYAKDLGVEHAVQFTGHVTHAEVSQFVNAADIAVVLVPVTKGKCGL